MLANITDTAISYSSVDAWIYSVGSSWVLNYYIKTEAVFIELGHYYAPYLPILAMASCRFLFVAVVAIVVRFFAVVIGHALYRLFVI